MQGEVPTILCERAETQLTQLNHLSHALRSVTFGDVVSFDPACGKICLGENCVKNAETLKAVGCSIADAVAELARAVEGQLTEFFAYMKQKEKESISAVLSGGAKVSGEIRKANQEVREGSEDTPRPNPALCRGPLSLYHAELKAGATSLKTCLFLMMESLLTRVMGCRAALYLRCRSEGTATLRRVLHINAHRFPQEVRDSDARPLIDAMEGCLALNIRVRTVSLDTAAEEQGHNFHPFRGKEGNSIAINCGMVFPISNYGCIIIADKYPTASHHFSTSDEYQAWAFASVSEGMMCRYHPRVLLDSFSVRPTKVPENCSNLPPISTRLHVRHEEERKGADLGAIWEAVPPAAMALKVMRVTRIGTSASPTLNEGYNELNYSGMLRDVGAHIRDLEEAYGKLSAQLFEAKETMDKAHCELNRKRKQQSKLESDIHFMRSLLHAEGIKTPKR